MPRRAAVITQADVARAIRAAKKAGATDVELRTDGTMIVHLVERPREVVSEPRIEWPKDLVP